MAEGNNTPLKNAIVVEGEVSWIFKILLSIHVVIACIAFAVGIIFAVIGISNPADSVSIVVENCFKALFEGLAFMVGALFGKVDHLIVQYLSH